VAAPLTAPGGLRANARRSCGREIQTSQRFDRTLPAELSSGLRPAPYACRRSLGQLIRAHLKASARDRWVAAGLEIGPSELRGGARGKFAALLSLFSRCRRFKVGALGYALRQRAR
jgi:hypothetical protein